MTQCEANRAASKSSWGFQLLRLAIIFHGSNMAVARRHSPVASTMVRVKLSALPSLLMPCTCGGRMRMEPIYPVVYADGLEDTKYRCSVCRTELIVTRKAVPHGIAATFDH